MTNAAIYLHTDAFDTSRPNLLGRHSAGESFLRGLIRHAEVDRFHFWRQGQIPQRDLEAALRDLMPIEKPIAWYAPTDRARLKEIGVANFPVPNLDSEAWARRPYGSASYALCGLTHTTATGRAMTLLSNFLLSPVEAHDALICTSTAVRVSVEAQLDGVRDYIEAEYGRRRRPEPQRVTIPLGVNVDDFATTPADRAAWRERLEIPEDAVVALYVGRFNSREKMNPALMALALERAAQQTTKTICWVNSGWAASDKAAQEFHDAARALCPSVEYRTVDGRVPENRFSIWSVADFFISFSDNIQESFGLTPVEAMAAGLPCVVTDWDGYRDTVRDGEDGFRIDTIAPAPGNGFDFAYWHTVGWCSYTDYVGAVAQHTAIDLRQASAAICALVDNSDLRRDRGAKAAARARSVFDWSAIIPQYQALWAEQNARRLASVGAPPIQADPFHPDPFSLFASYPTRHFGDGWSAAVASGLSWEVARDLLSGPLAAYGSINRPTITEVEQIFTRLASRPGAMIPEIVEPFPEWRRPALARSLLWLARFGVVELSPPPSRPVV